MRYLPHMIALALAFLLVSQWDSQAADVTPSLPGATPDIEAAFRRGYESGLRYGTKAATKDGCTINQMFGKE